MTVLAPPVSGLAALRQRLRAVAPTLFDGGGPAFDDDAAADCDVLIDAAFKQVAADPTVDKVWLLWVALTASFPTKDEVLRLRRRFDLELPSNLARAMLSEALTMVRERGTGLHPIRLVEGGVIVDVDFSAKHDLQTGIQRVVRHLLPRWHRDHDITLTVWTARTTAWREPVDEECDRVLRWTGPLNRPVSKPVAPTLVVPWRSTILLPEVPGQAQLPLLSALAEYTPNRMALIGYDCIPITLADVLPVAEPERFVCYLTVVKHCDVVAAISAAAGREFAGFADALSTQGIDGPAVTVCPLAADLPEQADGTAGSDDDGAQPEVVVVGSHDPRKNHLAVLHAAETLWREGLSFQLRFIGNQGWSTAEFDRRVEELQRDGRPLRAERGLADADLWRAYAGARFTVFPSLQEGYGLPVVESLAAGTPVIGSAFGSIAEIGADGGVVLVDPRNDGELTDAMRLLLTDDGEIERLQAEADRRPERSWDHYALELWRAVTGEDS